MSNPTKRDRIWHAVLRLSRNSRHFDTSDVLNVADLGEEQRRTARRVLHVMREYGWIEPRWPGSRAIQEWTAGEMQVGADNVGDAVTDQEAAEAELGGVEFPMAQDREKCIAAVYATRNYLRERGSATMREIVTDVMPEHPLGYDVPELEEGDRFRGAWWRKVVKPGLEELPDVEAPKTGGNNWRFVGEPS